MDNLRRELNYHAGAGAKTCLTVGVNENKHQNQFIFEADNKKVDSPLLMFCIEVVLKLNSKKSVFFYKTCSLILFVNVRGERGVVVLCMEVFNPLQVKYNKII
jgi:hypothetical protein